MPYTTIYPYIRTRLQENISELEDSDLDSEIESALRRLLAPYGLAYSDVTGDDLLWVDEAAGLTVAARLITPYSTGGANADLTGEQTETTKRQFGPGSEKDRWLAEARSAMAQTSFAKLASSRSGSHFAVGGYRRTQESNCDY